MSSARAGALVLLTLSLVVAAACSGGVSSTGATAGSGSGGSVTSSTTSATTTRPSSVPAYPMIVTCWHDPDGSAVLTAFDPHSGAVVRTSMFAATQGKQPCAASVSTDLRSYATTRPQNNVAVPGSVDTTGIFHAAANPPPPDNNSFAVTLETAIDVVFRPGTNELWWLGYDQNNGLQVHVHGPSTDAVLHDAYRDSASLLFDGNGTPLLCNSGGSFCTDFGGNSVDRVGSASGEGDISGSNPLPSSARIAYDMVDSPDRMQQAFLTNGPGSDEHALWVRSGDFSVQAEQTLTTSPTSTPSKVHDLPSDANIVAFEVILP